MWESVLELVDEVRQTHNALAQLVDDLHADTGVSVRLRAILEYVSRHGPATVPDIARARRVSRQHVQTTVNELLALGLVAYRPNPSHRRSHLVALTDEGADTIAEMQFVERAELRSHVTHLDPTQVVAATETIRSLRTSLPHPRTASP